MSQPLTVAQIERMTLAEVEAALAALPAEEKAIKADPYHKANYRRQLLFGLTARHGLLFHRRQQLTAAA